jgi:hypothetical protein
VAAAIGVTSSVPGATVAATDDENLGVVPDDVQSVLRHYLSRVDAAVPGLVEGLYLIGSLALEDYQPGVSDIDFIAVSSSPVGSEAEEALAAVHEEVATADPDRPAFEGSYVTFDDLRAPASQASMGLRHHDGALSTDRTGRTPVDWFTLARHGVAIRGPQAATLGIATDRDELSSWCRTNLDRYWRPWVERSQAPTPTAMAMLSDWGVAWGVLGVSRVHYTLATGEITSKSRAGWHGMKSFPSRWRDILGEALRCRPHPPGPPHSLELALGRRAEAIAFMEVVLEAAAALK